MQKISLAVVVLVLVAGLSAFTLVYVPANHYPTYSLQAEVLTEKPDRYVSLENPNAYVLEAIANPHQHITLTSLENTQIYELSRQHNTNNFLVNGSYYQIDVVFGDNFPSLTESQLYWISMVALPLALTGLAIIAILKVAKNKK
jgi:hypothetical protein